MQAQKPKPRVLLFFSIAALLLAFVPGCDSSSSPAGITAGPDIDPPIGDDPLPGVLVEIKGIVGGTGAAGNFAVGDFISVDFTLATKDGRTLNPANMTRGAIMVSGPTFNYQRVIESQGDLFERLIKVGADTWRYTFQQPIPATYLEPINYTGRFPEGVLAGQALLSGTYTVGIEARKDYEIDGESYRDVGNAHADFLFGSATAIDRRAVVQNANCNICHNNIQAHGGNRTEVTNCLLCHTSGAEDKNEPGAAGGSPDVTIDFKVMIHKIHAGKSLPSVQGVTTKPDGTRDYDATPKPYEIVGYRNSVHDYSDIVFPIWPSLYAGMPRDAGYDGLSSAHKAKENQMLSGPVACAKCHGDPDGAGPEAAPAQGDLIYSQLTRSACGSCHDDWVWDRPYTANTQTMPPQTSDSTCTLCHKESGDPLAVRDAHNHPLLNKAIAPGLQIKVSSLLEAGTNNGDGNIDPGEKIKATFTIEDDTGAPIDPSTVSRVQAILAGPAVNPNLLYNQSLPMAALGAGPTHEINLPEAVQLEFVGTSTASNGDVFSTARSPHWNLAAAGTTVYVRTATGGATTLQAAAKAGQNYLDLSAGGGASFSHGDYLALEVGVVGKEEYMRVQHVDGDRVWFSSPHSSSYKAAIGVDHASGATVTQVTLSSKTAGTDYSLNATTGQITELVEFGAGARVVVDYTTDFVVPAVYPGAPNDSPDLDSSDAKWQGLSLVNGTYRLSLSGRRAHTVTTFGQNTSYSEGNRSAAFEFTLGDDVSPPAPRIESPDTCKNCHDDLQFHGGNHRGFDTCMGCHGVSGAEDRPQYVAGNAPATTGRTIEFRTMLHKIHQGKELAAGSNYQIVGYGPGGYPNNFSAHTFDKIGFPDLPGGVRNCRSCHGEGNTAFLSPVPRQHPLGQPKPSQVWRSACASCHDSDAAGAHIDANTSPGGAESCAVCHGTDRQWAVEKLHQVR